MTLVSVSQVSFASSPGIWRMAYGSWPYAICYQPYAPGHWLIGLRRSLAKDWVPVRMKGLLLKAES